MRFTALKIYEITTRGRITAVALALVVLVSIGAIVYPVVARAPADNSPSAQLEGTPTSSIENPPVSPSEDDPYVITTPTDEPASPSGGEVTPDSESPSPGEVTPTPSDQIDDEGNSLITPPPAAAYDENWPSYVLSVSFEKDSYEPAFLAETRIYLSGMIPPTDDLSGYVLVVQGYSSTDETVERLAAKRADAVADILIKDLRVAASSVRTQTAAAGSGNNLQRVDISFFYTGYK